MKFRDLIFIGVLFSLVGVFIFANTIEDGNINAVSMYVAVYGIPVIILAIVNVFYLKTVELKIEKLIFKALFAILPILFFIGFSFAENLKIEFVGKSGLYGIVVTNLIWFLRISK